MQRNHLAPSPILRGSLFGVAALALAIGAFILTMTGSLREAFDLALSREEAAVPSITVRPLSASLTSQEAIIRELQRVEGVQGVTATFHGAFKPEEERHSSITRLPDTIQGTWSELPGLEFPLPSGKFSMSAALTGRLPQTGLSPSAHQRGSGQARPADINEAVIGYELARRLGEKVGDTLVVNEHPLVIVGIWQPSIFSPGNVVQVPYDTIRQWLPRSEHGFDEMTVILAPGYDAEAVARRIWDKVPQVEVLSPTQERVERRQVMLILDLVVLYSMLLTVLIGGVTTLNATFMATRELSAISYQPSAPNGAALTLRRSSGQTLLRAGFSMVQPLLATLAGGLGGLLVGRLAVLGLNAYTVHHQARTLFIATLQLAGRVVLLSVLVGLAAGVWPALWAQFRPDPEPCRRGEGQSRKAEGFTTVLAVLGLALTTSGVMLIGSLVENLYCSLGEGQRAAADRIGLEPTSSQVAYYEPLTAALRRWPGILDIAVEAYGGTIVEEEERWIDRVPPSGVFYGLLPALSGACPEPCRRIEGSEREDFGLGVPYRVGLQQGRVFQSGSLDEAVIGHDLATRQGLKVGDTLTIRDHDFTVVGIRQWLAYGRMNDFNLRAEVSLEAMRRILGQPYAFGTITAFIPSAEREEDRELFLARLVERFSGTAIVTVKDRLAEIARDFPGLDSLVVESPDDTLLRARLLYFGLLAGASISLWGLAVLGMMSSLRLSLAKSRQEIQIRKLFGASDGDILARWLERATLWGGIGGLIGTGVGWLAVEVVLHSPLSILHPPLIVTPRLVIMTVVVAVLLGVIAGLGPAWQAARLNPLWEN